MHSSKNFKLTLQTSIEDSELADVPVAGWSSHASSLCFLNSTPSDSAY